MERHTFLCRCHPWVAAPRCLVCTLAAMASRGAQTNRSGTLTRACARCRRGWCGYIDCCWQKSRARRVVRTEAPSPHGQMVEDVSISTFNFFSVAAAPPKTTPQYYSDKFQSGRSDFAAEPSSWAKKSKRGPTGSVAPAASRKGTIFSMSRSLRDVEDLMTNQIFCRSISQTSRSQNQWLVSKVAVGEFGVINSFG